MANHHKNFAETTLAAAITDTSGTSITVTSETSFPAAPFIISIDTECLLVTMVSGTTWTVTRGYESSTAATHTNGTAVYHDWSAGEADSTVQGPASATGDHLAVFDGATGKLIKDGGTPARGLDVNVQSLTGDLTLSADSPRVQVLNPNGASRTITLPSPTAGLEFYIVNAGAYNSTNSLLIALSNVYPQTMLHCIGDGTNWIVEIISGWNDGNGYNVAVGKDTSVYSYGTAVGCKANGFTSGTAVGYQANGNTYGTAVGYGAIGNSYSTAVGYNAITNSKSYAIALGHYAKCQRYGECAINGDQSSRKAASYLDHWTGQTTDATQTELYLKGIASNRCVLQAQSSILFSLSVVARDDANNKSKAWEVKGAIQRNNASATALVGSVTKTIVADSGVAWDVTVDADDTNESLRVQVTGAASTTIRWYVAGRLTEVVA